jgi:hypothetical protein
MLAVGTSGQVLQTNGVGAPSWITPSAGALTLISTQTLSGSADPTFTTGISSTYKVYKVYMQLNGNSGGNTFLPFFRFYANGGIDNNTGPYGYKVFNASNSWNTTSGQSSCQLYNQSIGGAIQYAWGLEITIFAQFSQTSPYSAEIYTLGSVQNGTALISAAGGYDGSSGRSGAITGFQINTGGQAVYGAVSLYGVTP